MREILFRAKKIDTGEWIEGQYAFIQNPFTDSGEPIKHIICNGTNIFCNEINPETLCQFIGMIDKNGKRIWENDIIKHEISGTIGTVKWYEEDYVGWCVDDFIIDEQQFTVEMWRECEVVGNIFDNQELLKEERVE